MIKTSICKGDKVIIIKGQGAKLLDRETNKQRICTVIKVDRVKGCALLEMPRDKQDKKKAEKQTPLKGVEQWKTARYNAKTGEAGGLKVVKRPVHVSNLKVVEKGQRREFGANK